MPFALLSVSDKTGIVDLGRGLVKAGFTLLSTGGTASALSAAGLPVTKVSDFTGSPEVFDGRVKSLHPRIHGGILGMRDEHAEEAAAHGIGWIDVVACNLYPFEATVSRGEVSMAEAIEKIDIGGPSMVRSAAKNHKFVTVLTDPADYPVVLAELAAGGTSEQTRTRLAIKAFRHTACYDGVISSWLSEKVLPGEFADEGAVPIRVKQGLRYGENPHQKAVFYAEPGSGGRSLARCTQLQGKELSFNNLADLDAGLRAAFEFIEPACVILKHMNPCGAAVSAAGTQKAFELALAGDPVSAFGGIICFNRFVEADTVRAIRKSRTFFEILAAPGFSDEAKELLRPRDNLRVMELPSDWADARPAGTDARRVQGGWLFQQWDVDGPMDMKVASARVPSDAEQACLDFAWRICRSVKSNAIVLARPEEGGFSLNGVGAGQMSRVDSTRIAVMKATRPIEGSVLASDAFFPFPDAVQVAAEAGVRAFIQPGGSIKDDEVVAAVDAVGGTMVMTGARHFRH